MHPRLFSLLLFTAAFIVTPPAEAAGADTPPPAYADAITGKFARGFANATTGWLELPKTVIHESRAHSMVYGVTIGLLEGVMHTIGRTLTGAAELGTFFVPSPEVVHPRFVWAPFEQNTTYGTN